MKKSRKISLGIVIVFLFVFAFVSAVPAFAAEDVPPGFPCKEMYSVHSGDTLNSIAVASGTPALVIIKINNLTRPDLLFPGQQLCVKYYVVAGNFTAIQSGETLTQVADQYDTNVDYLAGVNGIEDPNTVYEGQIIFVPRSHKYFPG